MSRTTLLALLALAIAFSPACSSDSGISGGTRKEKGTGKEAPESDEERDAATAGHSADQKEEDEDGDQDGAGPAADHEDDSPKNDAENPTKDAAPPSDEAANLANLNAAEIVVIRRLPSTTGTFPFFFYAENDGLRPRGINLATDYGMNPNFTIYPKKLGNENYAVAITHLENSQIWEGFLADRKRAIKAFFAAIEAKGLNSYDAAACRNFNDFDPVVSDNASAPPTKEQIRIIVNVPVDGGMKSFDFRESASKGCGTVNAAKFEAAAAKLLERAHTVRAEGFLWQDEVVPSLQAGACPVAYAAVCAL